MRESDVLWLTIHISQLLFLSCILVTSYIYYTSIKNHLEKFEKHHESDEEVD